MATVAELGRRRTGTFVAGCGHAGDGNVHLSVFQPDPEERHKVMRGLFAAGMALGGAISGEHGIGTDEEEVLPRARGPGQGRRSCAASRRPSTRNGILNPGTLFD